VVQLAARPGRAEPAAELPRETVRNPPQERHRQGDLRVEHQQRLKKYTVRR